MASGRYSRSHEIRFDGGMKIPGSPSADIVLPPWSDAAAVDPEEAFVASISACHMLWFLDLARRDGFVAERYADHAVGVMTKNESGALWVSRVVLTPAVTWTKGPDSVGESALHDKAHHACFIANSVKTEIIVKTP
jgi:organic hydroperoxide reductase OsmC/OhrA